ncbi:MAG: 16S rRNA (guanine(527)-N(7))-methyltransferase RsmG [Actinomycetota bacterium]
MSESEPAALLRRYAALVRHWAPRLDLVSPGDLERFEERHIEDSLRLLPLVQARPPGPAVDVGSGAGLPGIPLAIADPSRNWRLLEPRARRAAFLEEVVRELGLDCEVLTATAEEAARDPRLADAHVFAASRALAPPTTAFDLLLPLVAPAGIAVIFVGEGAKLPAKAELWSPGIAKMARSRD